MTMQGPLRIGIGGPVGAGKTTLTEMLCRDLSGRLSMAVITNDIYTSEDAEYLMKKQVLPLERIKGVETGGCPHTAIREDASINLAAIDEMNNVSLIQKITPGIKGYNASGNLHLVDHSFSGAVPRCPTSAHERKNCGA